MYDVDADGVGAGDREGQRLQVRGQKVRTISPITWLLQPPSSEVCVQLSDLKGKPCPAENCPMPSSSSSHSGGGTVEGEGDAVGAQKEQVRRQLSCAAWYPAFLFPVTGSNSRHAPLDLRSSQEA